MSAAVAVDEYLWNGITYDPDEPDVTGYIIIPDLPPVVGSDVACPGCGQTLDVICGVDLIVPRRYYRRPRIVRLPLRSGHAQRRHRPSATRRRHGVGMTAVAHRMDPEFHYFRVTGAADETEALATATAAWPEFFGIDPEYGDEVPALAVESKGWYRCQPCVCGLEHPYDVWPTEQNARGATFTYLIGLA